MPPTRERWDEDCPQVESTNLTAQYFRNIAIKVAFEKELKWIEKRLFSAANRGNFTAEVGCISGELETYLKARDFTLSEGNDGETLIFF